MEKEWRKTVDVHPVVLYKKDIIELITFLMDCEENQKVGIAIKFGYKGLTKTLTSIEDLRNFSKEDPTGDLSIAVRTRDDAGIINGITLTMYNGYVSYKIYSKSETWFLGKISQLDNFFKKNKPWYAPITRFMRFTGPALVMSFIYLFISSIQRHNILLASLSVFFTILMIFISYSAYKNKIFPFVRIVPSDQQRRIFTAELVTIIISITGTIIIPILSNKL